jgi:hypothetical protein
MKTAERDMARILRREGCLSIRDIERQLGVARSSVSRWVRDIELTPEQDEALLERNPARNRQIAGNAAWSAMCRERRSRWQEEGRAAAGRGEATHVAGCMLFWAEGSRAQNTVQFTNSDPAMLAFFTRFLRAYFDVKDDDFHVWCNLFADHLDRQREIEDFWLDTIGLSRSCLGKTAVNRYSRHSKRERLNMLPYGTCRVSVHRTAIVQHIYGAIQEYAGFDRPEWLG